MTQQLEYGIDRRCFVKSGIVLAAGLVTGQAGAQDDGTPASDLPPVVYVVPNFHPASCGWLVDFSLERNYCANSYLDHLNRVRDDPNYCFAFSEVNNIIAFMNFHPERVEELKQRLQDRRVELCNAFFLEAGANISGGEALVRCGIEGLRWQEQVFGIRPRFAWLIDICGMSEQMAQITDGLGLEAFVYGRHNPTGVSIHWLESPDGTKTLGIAPGHYSDWKPVFQAKNPLTAQQLEDLAEDLRWRSNAAPLTPEEIQQRRAAGNPLRQRSPVGAPVLIFGGASDYSLAPRRRDYPSEFLKQFKKVAPRTEVRFSTPGRYLDAVLPGVKSGEISLPTMRCSTKFSYKSFWIQNARSKTGFRRCEHRLQAAEMLASIASLRTRWEYPTEPLYHAWLQLLLNSERDLLWGQCIGDVFESDTSWDVRDRQDSIESIVTRVLADAGTVMTQDGGGIVLYNPLNWRRKDPVLLSLSEGGSLADVVCQTLPGTATVLVQTELPSLGLAGLAVESKPPAPATVITLPATIETRHYSAVIDPRSGALSSLRLKPSGREILGGLANEIIIEQPKESHRSERWNPAHEIIERSEREIVDQSSRYTPAIRVTAGPLATIVEVDSTFHGGGRLRRVMRFYQDYPRIDCETELNDLPDRTVCLVEFPLAGDVTEVRRGVPYGFSHAAWSKPNPELSGWAAGIVPAVRWSHYMLDGGGGAAIFDRGLTGRELTGRTPLLFLVNASDQYEGIPTPWVSGRGRHHAEYAFVAHDGGWNEANIQRLAWEFNCPPVVAPGRTPMRAESFLTTSENLIVEALRREGSELELRCVEVLGQAGTAEITLHLPHSAAVLTDMVGGRHSSLVGQMTADPDGGMRYTFPIRSQQIVTLRFLVAGAIAEVPPLTDWTLLVPPEKRTALNTKVDKKGHPPFGNKPLPSWIMPPQCETSY